MKNDLGKETTWVMRLTWRKKKDFVVLWQFGTYISLEKPTYNGVFAVVQASFCMSKQTN